MTTLREAAQQFVADYENGDLGDLKHYARALRAALEQPEQEQHTTVHMSHCNQGEWDGVCNYGEEQCPALEQPEPDRPTIEQMMAVIGENQRLRAELKFGSIEPEQLEGS
jgi:hypothetical protein